MVDKLPTAYADAFWTSPFEPLLRASWYDIRGFWLQQILDDRYVVVYFLPLLLILLLTRRDRLRRAIVLATLVFLAYVFGLLYAAMWLALCVALFLLSERFAIECRRTDVLPIGPPLAAASIIGGGYVGAMLLNKIDLPLPATGWLNQHLPWLFPLGVRGLHFEPFLRYIHQAPGTDEPPQLLYALFYNVHNIGIAYLAARMLHYFSEIRRDSVPSERRNLLHFLSYTCYGPALIQGPLERYQAFHEQIDTCHERRSWRNVPRAAARMGVGLAKSILGTLYLQPILLGQLGLGARNDYYQHPEQITSFWLLYLGVFVQIFWLYVEFSGYCDISAGMAHLLGYRQVENFAMPWIATSLRDFWRRWHISLSFLLRDCVYIPLGGSRRRALFNVCLTFVLCGLWHSLTPKVAFWGVLMGLMIAVNHVWAEQVRRADERGTGWLAGIRRAAQRWRPLPRLLAWLVTQHAFVFSLLVFFGGWDGVRVLGEIVRRLLCTIRW